MHMQVRARLQRWTANVVSPNPASGLRGDSDIPVTRRAHLDRTHPSIFL